MIPLSALAQCFSLNSFIEFIHSKGALGPLLEEAAVEAIVAEVVVVVATVITTITILASVLLRGRTLEGWKSIILSVAEEGSITPTGTRSLSLI